MFENIVLGFCTWDIPALILLIAAIAMLMIQQAKHRKKMRVLQKQAVNSADNLNA